MRHHAAVGRASIPRTPRFGPSAGARQQITPRFGPFEVARQTRALRGATPAVPWESPEFEFGSCASISSRHAIMHGHHRHQQRPSPTPARHPSPQPRNDFPRPRRRVALVTGWGASEAGPSIGERACAPIHAATAVTHHHPHPRPPPNPSSNPEPLALAALRPHTSSTSTSHQHNPRAISARTSSS